MSQTPQVPSLRPWPSQAQVLIRGITHLLSRAGRIRCMRIRDRSSLDGAISKALWILSLGLRGRRGSKGVRLVL